jgi:hypothetical protein
MSGILGCDTTTVELPVATPERTISLPSLRHAGAAASGGHRVAGVSFERPHIQLIGSDSFEEIGGHLPSGENAPNFLIEHRVDE